MGKKSDLEVRAHEISVSIEWPRSFLVILVVLAHAYDNLASYAMRVGVAFDVNGLPSFITVFFSQVLARVAVPLFFLFLGICFF